MIEFGGTYNQSSRPVMMYAKKDKMVKIYKYRLKNKINALTPH